jgi:hypothetical protein
MMSTSDTNKGVRTHHPAYDAMVGKWKKCRDAAAGEAAIHAAGETYLPKLAEEEGKAYAARLARTPFFNATWRTIAGLRGMMFRKPETIEAPAGPKGYFDDVNMAGDPLTTFAQKIVADGLTVGRVGVLVDHPQAPAADGVTVAQAAAAGLRPTLQMYPAESIINWRVTRIGNASVLSQAVLVEQVEVTGGDEFAHVTETRYRVLDLAAGIVGGRAGVWYRQRVYRIDSNGKDEKVGGDVFPLMDSKPMPFIPFAIIGVDCVGPEIDEPPLIDLVDMNLHHYTVSADYEHGCHFSGLPTLFISGYSPAVATPGESASKIYIGGPSANCLPQSDAKAYFVETSGTFEALRLNLEDKKTQMAVLGARMLEAQKAKVETAETVAQHRKGEESLLASMAQTISLGMTRALGWFAQWAGADASAVKYEICRDFAPTGMTAQELTALVGAWQAGAISDQVLFDNLQAREVIEPDVTFEEEQARIGAQPPKMAAPVVAAGA